MKSTKRAKRKRQIKQVGRDAKTGCFVVSESLPPHKGTVIRGASKTTKDIVNKAGSKYRVALKNLAER